MKPVARALLAQGIEPTLIFTRQHPSLDPAEFDLERFERFDLHCPGRENPHAYVRAVTEALLPIARRQPDLLIVQGDTSSALGGALAGFTSGVPVAHVEAGLRTHDPRLPWPEEEYRTAIDADAELLFAPTSRAAENLLAEDVHGEIHLTGNTGIDAFLEARARLSSPAPRSSLAPRLLVTCHRRESWEDGLRSIAAAIMELATIDSVHVEMLLHPNPYVAEKMRHLLGSSPNVRLLPACSHPELLQRMRGADIVLSDSGGIQEEAPALGVPLLVLRDKTERPEAIETGAARLVGTNTGRITGEVRRLLGDPAARAAMSTPRFPFGDGHAAARIAAIVANWLERRSLTRRLA